MIGLFFLLSVVSAAIRLEAEKNPSGMTDKEIKKGNLTFSLCSVAFGLVFLIIVVSVICVNRKKENQEGR